MNSRDSFNHFVRGNEQCLRYCEAERFRGLEIDDWLEFHGLLDWQVAGLFAFDHRSGMAGRNTPPAETNSDAERPTAWLGM